MDDDSGLWVEVYAAFEFHRKDTDPTAQAAMNRVAAKCVGDIESIVLGPERCSLRQEILTNEDLAELKLFHSRDQPSHLNDPIVVLLHKGEKFVIEGNTRVNAWLKGARSGPYRAILVERKQ